MQLILNKIITIESAIYGNIFDCHVGGSKKNISKDLDSVDKYKSKVYSVRLSEILWRKYPWQNFNFTRYCKRIA